MRKFYLLLILSVLLIADKLGAQLTCPADQTIVLSCPGSAFTRSQIVTYSGPTFDAVGGGVKSWTVLSGLASGSVFPVGTTTVTLQAQLECDPLIQPICSATCSFKVTLIQPYNVTYYVDADGDTYGDSTNPNKVVVCVNPSDPPGSVTNPGPVMFQGGTYYSTDGTDCDDTNPNVWRQAIVYVDHDGDGYDNGKQTTCYGNTWPNFGPFSANLLGKVVIPAPGYSLSTLGPDCNDEDKTIHSMVTYYRDADGDGYGDPTNPTTVCQSTPPSGYVTNNTDCNDNDFTVNPTTQWVIDADKDGYYVGNIVTQCTSPGTDYVQMIFTPNTDFGGGPPIPNELPGDCDDHNPAVHATFAFYVDNDHDGHGVGNLIPGVCAVNATTPPVGYSLDNTDCDDNNSAVWATTTIYTDRDHDGYDAGSSVQCTGIIDVALLSLGGYSLTTKGPDCDDNNAAINPTTVWYKDADNDGYSDGTTVVQCQRPTGYKLVTELLGSGIDCDDSNPVLNPATVWYKDADNDNYSDGTTKTQCTMPAGGYKLASQLTATSGDCNDADPTINPGAVEVCGNGIDDNCNGLVDEKACYACQNGANLTTTQITASSAQFNWVSIPNSRQWQIEYKSTAPGSKWIDILLTGNLRSTPLTGLKSNTNYQWHMRALCGKNWTDYSVAVAFKTLGSGAAETSTIARPDQTPEIAELQVNAMPNPTNTNFTISVKGSQSDVVKMIVVDMFGRIVEQRTLLSEQTLTIGDRYMPGVYIVRFMQGEQNKQLKLIKMPQ